MWGRREYCADIYGFNGRELERRGSSDNDRSVHPYGNRNSPYRRREIPKGYGPMHFAPLAPENQECRLGGPFIDISQRSGTIMGCLCTHCTRFVKTILFLLG